MQKGRVISTKPHPAVVKELSENLANRRKLNWGPVSKSNIAVGSAEQLRQATSPASVRSLFVNPEKSLTEEEKALISEFAESSGFLEAPTYENLKALMMQACKIFEQIADLGHVGGELSEIGQAHGMSKTSADLAVREGFESYHKEIDREYREHPHTIALNEAKQALSNGADLRTIVYSLAQMGIERERIERDLSLWNPFDPDKEKQRIVDDAFEALGRSFDDTPGAANLIADPSATQLLTALDQAAGTHGRFIPVELFNRLMQLMIDAEKEQTSIPEMPYKSDVDFEVEKIRENPTMVQLKESAERVAFTPLGVSYETFVQLCGAVQWNGLSKPVT